MTKDAATPDLLMPRFVIQPEEAESMGEDLGVADLRDLLPMLLPAARKLARPPISGFHVGAAALGVSGRIYLGANVEFPGVPLHHSIHAEQFLITNAALHAEQGIRFIAVSEFPCGHCRQFLQEIRSASKIQILITGGAGGTSGDFRPLSFFLPNPFGPADLLPEHVPLILERRFNDLSEVEENREICNHGLGLVDDRLREAAFRAARASHAPYSGSPSGFSLADSGGRVYAGSYTESAAYNPSLGPVQAAIVAYLVAGGGDDGGRVGEGIVAAALAEMEGAPVSQEETVRVFLSAVAPKSRFSAYRLRPSAGVASMRRKN
ncbi:hypothetical protein KSP40_PGU018676 [Platanthera guangdongensis]|uniref:cytidine deaminase n=1 Tax=Platanthera guangdongensis TaxID=2320717 RepID=A0ABR2M1E7_9ASPA